MRDSSTTSGGAGLNSGTVLGSNRNPLVKSIKNLAKRRERDGRHETWVEGDRELARALLGGWRIKTLLVREDAVQQFRSLCDASDEWHPVAASVFAGLVYRESTVLVGAICQVPPPVELRWDRSLMVLDGVEKPGNIGAILRSAEASGFPQIAVCGQADINNPNTIRASVGARFLVPVVSLRRGDLQAGAVSSGLPVYLALPGEATPWPPHLADPAVYVLGAEAQGVDASWLPLGQKLSLPMLGRVDSLNVAQVATVLMYQRLAGTGINPANPL